MTAGRMHYPWERFWVDAERRIEIDSESFFPDPRAEHSWLRPTVEAHTLEELGDRPCLILLGEPGLGKSRAIDDAIRTAPVDSLVQRVNLAAYPDAGALRAILTEGEAWQEWIGSRRQFSLYLDSLDEATLSFPALPKFLLEELRGASDALDSLRLRIACRSAEWMEDLADGLKGIWPGEEGGTGLISHLSLAPLRERDVRVAATAEGLDPDELLGEIRERELEGLAALPLTLRMMLDIARRGGGLPRTQAELFELGVRNLLDEPDSLRTPEGGAPRMEIGERIAVAGRISATLLLSRRSGASLLPGHGGPGDVDPAEIAGFEEIDRLASGGDRFSVGTAEILETLRTALFVRSGHERVTFSHRSLGEFCAGVYLANAELDRVRLRSLLFAASDTEGRLIPQLREVAAWAAALDPTALDAVLESEPEVLLRVDRLGLDDGQRARVVDGILNQESAERIGRWDRRIWRALAALDHPQLPDQLDPLILDRDADWSVRRLAITMARVCGRRECEPALLTLALDEDSPSWIRDDAVWALREYGSRTSREALIPLAVETIDDDVDDEIKGSSLMAVFPGLVSAKQVFEALTPPRNSHLIGAYSTFLHRQLPGALDRSDLPVALRWAVGIPSSHGVGGGLQSLLDGVLARAWQFVVEEEEIAGLLADVVRPRLKAHVDLLNSFDRGDYPDAFRDTAGRHRLIELLMPDLIDGSLHAANFVVSSPALIVPADFSWCLSRLKAAIGAPEEAAWVQLARMAFSLPVADQDLEALERLCPISKALEEEFAHWIYAVPIDSPEADQMREIHQHTRPTEEEAPDRAEEMEEALEEDLRAAERGEDGAWWRLNHTLLFNEHGRTEPRLGEWEADLTALPGWQRSSPAVQIRITALAQPALDQDPPDPTDWFEAPTFNRAAYAGYRALFLLAKLEPDLFRELEPTVWERWMPIVVDFPTTTASNEDGINSLILQRASELDPSTFALWAARKLAAEAEKDEGHLFFRHSLEGIRSPELDDQIVSMVADRSLRPNSLRDLLPLALGRDPDRVRALLSPRFADAPCDLGPDDPERECLVVCASKLLGSAPAQAWPDVASFMERCPGLGREVILGLAHEERTSIATEMSDDHLSDFLTWIFQEFPPASDPALREGVVSPRENLVQFRGWLLDALAERGTDGAIGAIEALYAADESSALRFALRKARDARRASSPTADPGAIIRTVCAGQIAPRDGVELLSVVCEALA